MKLLLAGFMLLASVSNLVMAAEPTGKEVLIITSNPQPCQTEGCTAVDSSITIPNVQAQYQWINKNFKNSENFVGVVVNGNWTAPGVDMFRARDLYLQLEVPYYFGIGANDYFNNRTTSPGNAILAIEMLNAHLNTIKTNYKKRVHSDFVRAEQSYQAVGIGSLGYAVELGKENNIYLIHLNDNGNRASDQFTLDNKSASGSSVNFKFHIKPIYDWLQTRLEYAARTNKKIIVTKNSAEIDPSLHELMDSYEVEMRFLGVPYGSSPLCANYEYVCFGFSTDKELLKLELDYDSGRYNIAKLIADSSNNTIGNPLTNGALVRHPSRIVGNYPPQRQVVIFRNPAWYNGFPSVTYKKTLGGADEGFQGSTTDKAMKLNDIFLVDVPKEVTAASQHTGKLTASYTYNWRDGKEILDQDARKNLEEAVICIRLRGTAGLGYADIVKSKKMGEGGEAETLNGCP